MSKENTKQKLPNIGNFIEKQLNSIIVGKNGKPDRLAIAIYSEFRSSFKSKKKNNNGLRISYEELAKNHCCSKELMRQKIVLLEQLGLLSRNFRMEYIDGRKCPNILHILLWKDTPHFYTKIGLEKVTTFSANQKFDPNNIQFLKNILGLTGDRA